MPAVTLVEFHWRGHHPTFFKLYARTLLRLGCRVLALCPQPKEVLDWVAAHVPEAQANFRAHTFFDFERLPVPDHRLRSIVASLLALQRTNRVIHDSRRNPFGPPDLVIFACFYSAKWVFPWLANRLLPYPWTCLFLKPATVLAQWKREERTHRFPFIDRLTLLRAKNCRAVLSLNEDVAAELSHALGGKPVLPMPDVTDLSVPNYQFPLAQRIVQRAKGRHIIGAFGLLGREKGHYTLLQAASRLPVERYFFVLAGPISSDPVEEARVLAEFALESAFHQENVLVHADRVPDGGPYNALVAQSAVLFMAYPDFPDSSNNMVKAAHFRKPIIVSKGYLMEARASRFRLGEAIPQGDDEACADAIERLAAPDWALRNHPAFDEFVREHSQERMSEIFAELLQPPNQTPGLPLQRS